MTTKRLLWWSPVLLLLVLQFFRIDKTNPPFSQDQDFIHVMQPPADVAEMLHASCYDCHSHETVYTWYSNIAPISWMLADHVRDGRRHLNFSTFSQLSIADRAEAIEEMVETVKEGEMPMKGYTIMHSKAALSQTQKDRLTEWLQSSNPAGGNREAEGEYED